MHFNLRLNVLLLTLLLSQLLYSQSIIRELSKSPLADTTNINLYNFQNGDLLLSEILHPERHIQLSRISPDLRTVIWSKIVKLNNLECDFALSPNYVNDNFLNSINIFIDDEDYIWLKYLSDLPTQKILNHLILLSQNGNLIWQKGFVNNHRFYSNNWGRIENTPGGVNIYTHNYRQNIHEYDTLTLYSVNYDGNAMIKTTYSFLNSDKNFLNNHNHVNLSPGKDKILQNQAIVGWRDSILLALSLPESNKCLFFKVDGIKLDILISYWGTTEWINEDEFIYYTFFSSSALSNNPENFTLLITRVNINGDVIWSKVTEFSKSYYYFYRWWNSNKTHILIEDDKVLIPLSGHHGSGSGFMTLDIETGNLLDSKFWYKNGMDSRPSEFFKVGSNMYLHNFRSWQNWLNVDNYSPFLMLDNLDDPTACMKIPVCNLILNDFPLEFELEETPLLISNPNEVLISRCSFEIEILPATLEWREICPEPIQEPDAFFTLSSDTICRRELVPVVVQYNHQYFEYIWHLNGTKIEPVSASNDTFYFDFDLEGEAELQLTTSRLGCESEYAVSFFLVPGAQIEIFSDTTKCIGKSIFLTLPEREGYNIQWENGTNPLQVDAAGIYTYTSLNTETGCTFRKSIEVTDQIGPRVDIDSFYTFCSEDLTRNVLPKPIGAVNNMAWINPDQGADLSLFPPKSDTYLLRVENANCVDTIAVEIQVEPCTEICAIFIPDAFSPNDDGINDYFEIFPGCEYAIVSYRMEVFDRWGNMVFQSDEFNHQWDGNFEGKLAPAGAYTYKLKMTLETEEEQGEIFKEGFVGLLR